LRRGLQRLGYSEGHNIELHVRYTRCKVIALPSWQPNLFGCL
jgi:hypothetical protein